MKKTYLVTRLNEKTGKASEDDNLPEMYYGTASSLTTASTLDEATKVASKKAGKDIENKYGIFELVKIAEAPTPIVNFTDAT